MKQYLTEYRGFASNVRALYYTRINDIAIAMSYSSRASSARPVALI